MKEEYTEGEIKKAYDDLQRRLPRIEAKYGLGIAEPEEYALFLANQVQCDLNRANELLRIVKNATYSPTRLFKVVSEFLDTQKEEEL